MSDAGKIEKAEGMTLKKRIEVAHRKCHFYQVTMTKGRPTSGFLYFVFLLTSRNEPLNLRCGYHFSISVTVVFQFKVPLTSRT